MDIVHQAGRFKEAGRIVLCIRTNQIEPVIAAPGEPDPTMPDSSAIAAKFASPGTPAAANAAA